MVNVPNTEVEIDDTTFTLTPFISLNAGHIELKMPQTNEGDSTLKAHKIRIPYNMEMLSSFCIEYMKRMETIRQAVGAGKVDY